MTGNDDDARRDGELAGRGRLRAVRGPLAAPEPPPAVRLVREWKGPTVDDLLRDEYVERLPGAVHSALRHLERGDLAAADRALPGRFPPILAGPGHARDRRRAVLLLAIVAALAAIAFASWLGA